MLSYKDVYQSFQAVEGKYSIYAGSLRIKRQQQADKYDRLASVVRILAKNIPRKMESVDGAVPVNITKNQITVQSRIPLDTLFRYFQTIIGEVEAYIRDHYGANGKKIVLELKDYRITGARNRL